MKKLINYILIALLIAASGYSQQKPKLTVAVAANVQFAMKDIKAAFEKKTGTEVDVIIGSSGQLTAQIKQGAPFDIFISADMKYPDALYKSKLAVETPEAYAYGALVVWTMKKDIQLKPDLSEMTGADIKTIALANPKTAPYGEATVQALKHYGIYEKVKDKLVYGESIAPTNQFIISGAADIGFTAKSVVLSPMMKGKGQWHEVASEAYKPIEQGCVILSYGIKNHPSDSKKFYDFLFSKEVKNILLKYGYKTAG